MFSIDCERCPARPGACDGCIINALESVESQVNEHSAEPCGFFLDPEVLEAVEVLREVGMVSTVRIVGAEVAA